VTLVTSFLQKGYARTAITELGAARARPYNLACS
jgi:hypothetical protein